MSEEKLPKRKNNRLKEYDYSENGCYFVTVCCDKRKNLLSYIVGDADPSVPRKIILKPYGRIVKKYIDTIETSYQNVFIDNYIIMPNHIHLLIRIDDFEGSASKIGNESNGTLGSASPTVSNVIKAFKRLTNKECNYSLWQRGFYDHIIRCKEDYENTWNYIEYNALKEYTNLQEGKK